MKTKPETESLKSESAIISDENSKNENTFQEPEDNTRFGDWVKNGRTIDF